MNLIKKLLLVPCIFTVARMADAQNVKPRFKELTVVAYVPNDSTKKLAVTINIYYHINADGIIHIIMNQMDPLNYHGKPTKYTGLVRDTTYQLADDVIGNINKIFNGERKLSSYMIRPIRTTGTSLILPATFISYVALNGATDKMVFGNDFFGRDMNLTLNEIYFARQARVLRSTGVYHDRALEAEILKDHLACKCIPIAETPPTVKNLPIKKYK